MTFKSHILHLSMKNIHQLYSYMVNNAEISNMFHVRLCHVLAMMNLMFYFVAGSEDTQKSYRSRHRIQKSCGFGSSNRTMSRSLSCDSQSKGSSVCTPRGSNVRWCFLPYRRTIFLCSLVILKHAYSNCRRWILANWRPLLCGDICDTSILSATTLNLNINCCIICVSTCWCFYFIITARCYLKSIQGEHDWCCSKAFHVTGLLSAQNMFFFLPSEGSDYVFLDWTWSKWMSCKLL